MSPATKSKSKDKSAARAVKEHQQKFFSKLLTAPVHSGNGIPGSAYNPVSGTFHTLETLTSAPSPAPPSNGRFRSTDETEEHCGSANGTAEYDSVSNNDSWSGESEDQKEKATASSTPRPEAIPGSDSDKRDKVRQKNERKHQRQRERRAQELHERCRGFLVTRKLDVLSQQLVAMGFPPERATLALILNEGQVEESVAWLLEGGEGEHLSMTNPDARSNLTLDISDELAKIADLEVRFKCFKQDVERAIIACEGDVEKAAETLKAQKQEPPASLPKLEESGDPASATATDGGNKAAAAISRTQVKAVALATAQSQRRDEKRDFNYSKAVVTGDASLESRNKNLQPLMRLQTKPEQGPRPQVATTADKRWRLSAASSSSPSVSYSSASSPPSQVAVPPAKAEARFAVVGTEVKTNLQTGVLREPVIVMQRPQSNAKPNPPPSSSSVGANVLPPVSTGWHPNGVPNIEMMKVSNGGGLGHNSQNTSLSTSSPGPTLQYYLQSHHQPFTCSAEDNGAAGRSGAWNTTGISTGALSAAARQVPSSLGLFTGWGSAGTSGSSSPIDWSTGGPMTSSNYNNIDWSLDSTPPPLSDWVNYDDGWVTKFIGSKIARPGMMNVNGGGVCMAGLKDGGGLAMDPSSSSGSTHEWTSPFAGTDLFRVPRQFVTSPAL